MADVSFLRSERKIEPYRPGSGVWHPVRGWPLVPEYSYSGICDLILAPHRNACSASLVRLLLETVVSGNSVMKQA